MSITDSFKSVLTDGTGIVITSPENRRYFTDFPSSDGFLLITADDAVFLTDSRYIEAAQRIVTCCPTQELKLAKEQLPAFFAGKKIKRLLFEADRLTVSEFIKLKEIFSDIETISDGRLDDCINSMRVVKSAEELDRIITAQRIAEKAFSHMLCFIREGLSEKEIALELDFFMLKNGAEALSFETIVASGRNSSMPHAVPSDKRVEKGDFITMDFGAVYKGYHSDMTRTVILGQPSPEQLEVYNTVLTAQRAALVFLKPGATGFDADKKARDIIAEAGYGQYFGHGTGHGVGIEIHEMQSLSPRSPDTLRAGNVVTVEPGIYLPGRFGVRIEDMAVITEDGYKDLTECEKELVVL